MAEGDAGRVEPRTVLVGMGNSATPERIAELERRAQEVERRTRKKPLRSFSQVLAQHGKGAVEAPLSPKDEKYNALPKRGPRPSLLHPAQRDAFGREEEALEPVVLKG